jgi:hypothetical protein
MLLWPLLLHSAESRGQTAKGSRSVVTEQIPQYPAMPQPGKKVPIGGGLYLIYGFDKTPKLGIAILKVEIFTADGKKDTSFEVKAYAHMPSMKGAHVTVERIFKISKNEVYLAPLDIVMPGTWEIMLTVIKDGKVFFRGSSDFDI